MTAGNDWLTDYPLPLLWIRQTVILHKTVSVYCVGLIFLKKYVPISSLFKANTQKVCLFNLLSTRRYVNSYQWSLEYRRRQLFVFGEQREGRQKGTGGIKTRAGASLGEVNPPPIPQWGLPRTSVLINTFFSISSFHSFPL